MDLFCYLCLSFSYCHVCSLQPCGYLLRKAFLFVMFSGLIVTFPCGVPGRLWYLIVSIPDICLLSYFVFCPCCVMQY